MKKFEKELLFSQVEGETTTGSGNGTTGENAGEGENDAPEQEPVDEGAEDDNNMYDGGIIDPVEVVAYPTDPADTPSDAEGPEEEEDESYYGDDSDVNDNSAPDNEYEYGDDGEGDGNTNEDDTQSSTEQSEEEKTETNETVLTEEQIATLLNNFADTFPNVSFDGSLTVEQKIAFIDAFLKLPSTLRNLNITVKFDDSLDAAGSYLNNIVTFRDVSSVAQATLEEFIHAYQDTIKSPEVMQATHAESEFEAKMLQVLNDYAQNGIIVSHLPILGEYPDPDVGGDDYYDDVSNLLDNFAERCFNGANATNLLNEPDLWNHFEFTVFEEEFEYFFHIWISLDTGYSYDANNYYNWEYWEDLFNIFINQERDYEYEELND